jgi:hypothetical protein
VTPLTSPLRRAAAILTGVLIGLTGIAAPAVQAAPPKPLDVVVTGEARCDPAAGKWTVTWVLSNWHLTDVTVHDLTMRPVPVDGLVEGVTIPHRVSSTKVGQRLFTQTVDGDQREASVSFTARGKDIDDRDNTDIVALDDSCEPVETPCVQPADVTFHHTFAVSETAATATVTLDDGIKLCRDEPVALASYFAPRPQFAVPQYLFGDQTDTITNARREITLVVAVPPCNTQVDLFFGGEDDVLREITADSTLYGDRKLGSDSGTGARSKGEPAWFNGGSTDCRQPDVTHVDQCDGVVGVNLSNTGQLSRYPVDFTITAGAFHRTVTVQPGTAETVAVPAGSGEITVTADGMSAQKFTWERPATCAPPTVVADNDCRAVTVTVTNPEGVVPATAKITYGADIRTVTVAPGKAETVTFKPGQETGVTVTFPSLNLEPLNAVLKTLDCTTEPPGGGSNGGGAGGLPITGAAAGALAGGAALLLIAGGALFLTARRRRIKFTA